MYALDYIKNINNTRIFLSGDNIFLKYYIIDLIKDCTKRKARFIDNAESIKKHSFWESFINTKFFNVFYENAKIENSDDIVLIKLGKKRPAAKFLKEYNLVEVICNDLFPNQIEDLLKIEANRLGLNIPNSAVSNIYNVFRIDIEQAINYLRLVYHSQITNYKIEELNLIPTYLVELFLMGENLSTFMLGLEKIRDKDYFRLISIFINKFREIGDFLDGRTKYKSKFLINKIRDLSLRYKNVDLTDIIVYLNFVREELMKNSMDKQKIIKNAMFRLWYALGNNV